MLRNSILFMAGIWGLLSVSRPLVDPPELVVPPGWPQPVYDLSRNPVTEAGYQLGRRLFYDPILSRDSSISCASCHLQATGFAHVDHALSHGIEDHIGLRNAPALMNLAWNNSFMWDGAVNHLDVQPLSPINHPDEMGETTAHVVAKLNGSGFYRRMFQGAFGDSTVTGQRLLLAMSQFMVLLESYNSKYDKHIRGEAGGAFSIQEENGLRLFRLHCAVCHSEPLFTNHSFANNGLSEDSILADKGRMRITGRREDAFKFKVPTLRNIQFTYPYMHDGRFKKLLSVMDHYASVEVTGTDIAVPIRLTHEEKIDLVAFLQTLTDRDFLFDPRWGFPR